jgi:hypothetical protein
VRLLPLRLQARHRWQTCRHLPPCP